MLLGVLYTGNEAQHQSSFHHSNSLVIIVFGIYTFRDIGIMDQFSSAISAQFQA